MCKICNSPDRTDIESAILAIGPETGLTVEKIAEKYEVDVLELRTHALFHTPLAAVVDITVEEPQPEVKPSLARKMKLREADILTTVNDEYLITLKTMGRRIKKLVSVSSIDAEDAEKEVKVAKLLTKPMVDMYVGLGSEIRQNVKAMAEVDRMLNGPQENASNGLVELANAIRGSGPCD